MARKALIVIFDIEFPDGMVNDEIEVNPPNLGRLAGFRGELNKIIRDGCSENSFSYILFKRPDLVGGAGDMMVCDLVAQ